ncbi:MAG TPA: S9 family peptidase [Mycobacteriales bacterium]|jgi:dipeptidyl aminopeptidase/acylaminoacyl peptidase|nr:S9 family peptidase [Mycobacteriales bacterium]
MKPTDIAAFRSPGVPTLSPDGRHAVVAVSRPDLEKDEYASQLWWIPTDGSAEPRALTHGRKDSAPRFSPDGRWLAFVRVPEGGKPQLHVMPTDGGEPRVVTDDPNGVGAPVWSPDSTQIAYVTRVLEKGRYGTEEKISPDKEPPRRITDLQFRRDNVGFLADRREHIFLVDPFQEKAEPRQLTDGDYDDSDVAWSPDGQWLTFVSRRHEGRDADMRGDVFVMAADGAQLRQVTRTSLDVGRPAFSADGTTIYFHGEDLGDRGIEFVGSQLGLYATAADGSGSPRRLTDAEQYNAGDGTDTTVLTADGILFGNENRGGVELLRVPFDGGEPQSLLGGPRQVKGYAAAAGVVVATVSDANTLGEVVVLRDGEPVVLTDFRAGLPAVLPMEELEAPAPDGYPVHGWLVRPEGAGPHPVLLMIHGGPFAQYGWTMFDEAQVYAGAGYAVVYGNPRGSSGYGAAHGRAIQGNVGERSAADLLALLDHALTRPELDGDRVGVLGGSHGGFMTSWLVGHTDRFAAAISERAVNAIDSFTGSSDIGWVFADRLYSSDLEQQRTQSPLTYAEKITTPVLIIHSENDWRCPIEQGQRLFVALKRRNAEVEMLIFPGEGHEMSRAGLPSHRVARFDAILEWWGRYLR